MQKNESIEKVMGSTATDNADNLAFVQKISKKRQSLSATLQNLHEKKSSGMMLQASWTESSQDACQEDQGRAYLAKTTK